jgi:hypothetical protein
MYMRDFPRLEPPQGEEDGEMNDTTTPRPNVATGAFMGFATMVMGLFLTALQTNPTTLEGWWPSSRWWSSSSPALPRACTRPGPPL